MARLQLAMDTLRMKNNHSPFITAFLKNRGLPLWDAYHTFEIKGKQVWRVPVRDTDRQSISGLIDIAVYGSHPRFVWIPRGTQPPGVSAEYMETIHWGYEQEVFSKKYTDQGNRINHKIENRQTAGRQKALATPPVTCWKTCAGYACGEWECEDDLSKGPGEVGSPDGHWGDTMDQPAVVQAIMKLH